MAVATSHRLLSWTRDLGELLSLEISQQQTQRPIEDHRGVAIWALSGVEGRSVTAALGCGTEAPNAQACASAGPPSAGRSTPCGGRSYSTRCRREQEQDV